MAAEFPGCGRWSQDGPVAVLVGGIYGFKSWEQIKTGKQGAEVEIAKAKSEAG